MPSITKQYILKYKAEPTVRSFAPGRVNLIGDHTDYNFGLALPIRTNEWITVVGDIIEHISNNTEITSQGFGSVILDIENPNNHTEHWARYTAGIFHLARHHLGPIPSSRLIVGSTIHTNSGLSSSAAFAISLLGFIEQLTQRTLNPLDKALMAQRAEHEFANVPCGLLDQLAIIGANHGHATRIDFKSLIHQPVPINFDQISFLIINSGVHRSLASSVYAQRHAECKQASQSLGVQSLRDINLQTLSTFNRLDPILKQRALHVITENQRVDDFVDALTDQDWVSAGELMYASHESLKSNFEVSCTELDKVVELAQTLGIQSGIYGARLTGGGMGGCAVLLINKHSADIILKDIAQAFNNKSNELHHASIVTTITE